MKTWIQTVERFYVPVMIGISALVVWLNYDAKGMETILRYYLDFKKIILAGFNPFVAQMGTPTFPMWGYGWVLLLTESKLVLLAAQCALAIFAVHFFLDRADKRNRLSRQTSALVKLLIALSLPWYVMHAVQWPYSIAMSLFPVSLILLLDALEEPGGISKAIIASGAIFGLLLNFRSDYYLMPMGFAFLILLFHRFKWISSVKISIWLASCYLMLAPWALYTKHVTGHYLLTSTNSGHVLFIGLGTLPGNKWGITPIDGDPTMYRLLESHFGTRRPSLIYESDLYLTAEFKRMVKEDPVEYSKKLWDSLKQGITRGCYSGEFYETPSCRPFCREGYDVARAEVVSHPFNLLDAVNGRYFLTHLTKVQGIAVVLLSFVLSPLVLVNAIQRRSLFFLLPLASIYYQLAINVVYPNAIYTSNMYLFHLINACVGLSIMGSFVLRMYSLKKDF